LMRGVQRFSEKIHAQTVDGHDMGELPWATAKAGGRAGMDGKGPRR